MTVPDADGTGAQMGCADDSLPSESSARLADVCARRAAVYQALAIGLAEPTRTFLDAWCSGELVDGLRCAVAWLGEDARHYEPVFRSLEQAAAAARPDPETRLRDMRVEHARLFTGPGRPAVMCYASQYLDADERGPGRLNGAAAAFAAAAYRAEGVAPVAELQELPDRMTNEVEFAFHLCRREEEAWEAERTDEALRLRRVLDAFLRQHAGRWLPDFAACVRAATPPSLYRSLADLLDTHIAVELGRPVREVAEGETRVGG